MKKERIICVPASDTGQMIETLGIYCRQPDTSIQEGIEYLMPRVSEQSCKMFLENKNYSLQPTQGNPVRGVCWCIYHIIYIYASISQCPHLSEKVNIWVESNPEYHKANDCQIFELEYKIIFKDLKYTNKQNGPYREYYTFDEVLKTNLI